MVATQRLQELKASQPDIGVEAQIYHLHVLGFSKIECIAALKNNSDLSFVEAKHAVHISKTFAYRREFDEATEVSLIQNLWRIGELEKPIDFSAIQRIWDWKEIENCPGRYVLVGEGQELTPAELTNSQFPVREFSSKYAKDPILVTVFPGGGLISYCKSDGMYVHTLGNADGLKRKLAQLEIQLEENP